VGGYAKRPFAGPAQVLDYVGRYTHRVAISTTGCCPWTTARLLPLEDYRDGNAEDDDARWRGVHPPFPDPCPAGRVPSHPVLRLPRQLSPRAETRALRELLRMAPAAPAEPPGNYRERFEALTGRSCGNVRTVTPAHVVIDSIMRPTSAGWFRTHVTQERRSNRANPKRPASRAGACAASAIGVPARGPNSQIQAISDRSKVWLHGEWLQTATRMPRCPPANVRGTFNAHSPATGERFSPTGFSLNGRIPAAESSRRGCAAARQRKTLYVITR